MKKVTKKSRHKNASTHMSRALPAFMSGLRAGFLIIDFGKERTALETQALPSSASFPACNTDYKKLKEAARESSGLAIVTMKCCCLKCGQYTHLA
ncbi:hypothetical protein [Chryseosolibacter indicus]|uniref:Uncharacterized protein n=1 Tax=Chryseosolibacter indicus TaxID=2782351 RepID=A0ABS5VWT4_9BACT|nr:hypothetical protein [Chryseosolibacter indicus]MBT1705885.1 hypothetical protein [Chryseosolibacter indicus]